MMVRYAKTIGAALLAAVLLGQTALAAQPEHSTSTASMAENRRANCFMAEPPFAFYGGVDLYGY